MPQLFWFRAVRTQLAGGFRDLSILVNVGMWFERFVIIVDLAGARLPAVELDRATLPRSIEIATLLGSFGLFFTCFLLFCRFLPMIAMAEVKGVLATQAPRRRRPCGAGRSASMSEQTIVGHFRAGGGPARGGADRPEPRLAHRRRLHSVCGARPGARRWACGVRGCPWPAFCVGVLGSALALWFQFWTTAWDWPLNVGGQPWNSLPAFVPVTFEIMVLFAGLGTGAGLAGPLPALSRQRGRTAPAGRDRRSLRPGARRGQSG